MSLTVVFVRHGESQANQEHRLVSEAFDPPLTAQGFREAEQFARLWQDQGVGALVSSPLKRTRQTAQVIAEVLGIETIHIDPRLHEIKLGVFDGQSIDYLEQEGDEAYRHWKRDPESPSLGGERLSQVYSRMQGFLQDLLTQQTEGLIMATTHADCLKAIAIGILKAPWEAAQRLHFGNLAALKVISRDATFQLQALPMAPLKSSVLKKFV